jgi:hypothetical protein
VCPYRHPSYLMLLIPFRDSCSFNAHTRSPSFTHAVVMPQRHGKHTDTRPSPLYEISGSQQYPVPDEGSSLSMGLELEQLARPGAHEIPSKPPPVVLTYLPAPQSPPLVSQQPTAYPLPSTGRSPSRGTEQDSGHPGGNYLPGGTNVNIFCCSRSSTPASRHRGVP